MNLGTSSVELTCRDQDGPVVGVCDGINATYTLTYRPVSNVHVKVYLNGLHQREGLDYTLAAQALTFLRPPSKGDTVDVDYTGAFTV